jgi:hypothetical protein
MRLTYIALLVTFLLIRQWQFMHEMRAEVQQPRQCVRAAVIACDTDTDCMLKNGGDGGPSVPL